MNHIFQKIGKNYFVAWMAGLTATVCLGLSGCSTIDKCRGDGFHDNSMGEEIRQAQPPNKKPQEFWSFSNKARQIESDFPDH
jgi:hypothetical protein